MLLYIDVLQDKAFTYDGGHDIHSALDLSREPAVQQVAKGYGFEKPKDQANATEIAENNVAKRQFQTEYLEYWNSSKQLSGTGRPADAVIMPIAPFAAARHGRYHYYGYTTVVNTLDFTSCAIPVSNVDKDLDGVDQEFQPMNDRDRLVQDDCK